MEQHELSEEGKAFLEKRLESALANPDQRKNGRKFGIKWPESLAGPKIELMYEVELSDEAISDYIDAHAFI